MSGSNLDSEQKVVDRISDSNKDTEMTDAEEAVESTSKDTNKGDASEVSQSEQTESNAEVTDTEESVKNNSDVLSNKDKAESSEMSSNQEYGESTRDVKATTNSVVSAEEVLEGKADDSVDATTEKIAEGTDEVENEAGKPKSTNEDGTANDTKSESELNKDSTDVGSVVAKKTDESSQADSKTDKNSSDEPERAQHDETDKKGVDDSIGMSSVAENGNADVGVSDETTGDQPAEKDHTDDHTREIVAETDTVQPDKDEGGSEMILNDTDKGEGPDGARDRPTADAVNQGDEMEATEYNEPEEVYLEEGEGEGAELDLMEMEEQEAPEEFAETEEAHDDGFVLLGSACTNYIEHNLAAGDPIDFIGQFQADSGLKIDHRSLAALPFLDVFGVPRSSLHKSFLESMREKLSERIKKLASSDIDTLNTLLEKSFIYFTHPELQDIPINIMKRLPVIPESILHHISISDEIYEACPMDVKRKVWLHANNAEGQARFRKIVYATITNFMDDETILRAQNDFTDLNPIPPKRRRQHAAVKNLVDIIGKSSEVYHMVLKLFETLFKNTQNRLYCTLRSELLMAFHDADVAEICDEDRCHKLLWCLDACKNDRVIDEGRIKDMQSFFSSHVASNDHIISDIAMIIIDPFTMNTFLCNVFNYLSEKVDLGAGSKGGLPNEDDRIRYISQLVSLGVSAHSSVVNEHYEIPEPDAFMLKEFMPALVCRMVDDAIAACEQHAGLPKSKFDPPALPEVLENECAQKLLGLYVLRCVDKNDVGRIRDLLPALKIPGLQPAVFVSVVIALLNKVDIDTSNDVRLLLLEEMLIPSTQDSITNHVEVIGLIGHVLDSNTGVGASKVTELLKSTIDQGLKDDAGGDDSARLVKEYQNLVHKLSALEVSTSQLAFATQYIKMVEELASKSEDESEEEDEEEEELVVE